MYENYKNIVALKSVDPCRVCTVHVSTWYSPRGNYTCNFDANLS